MATNAEMFAFLSNFGPMLGELAARVAFLESRIEVLEARGVAAPGPGASDPAADVPDESFEIMGQKIDMKALMESGLPPGGMAGMMDRLKNWKPPATGAPTTNPPNPPANGGAGGTTT